MQKFPVEAGKGYGGQRVIPSLPSRFSLLFTVLCLLPVNPCSCGQCTEYYWLHKLEESDAVKAEENQHILPGTVLHSFTSHWLLICMVLES